ncbi:hypothetical protein SM123_03580 [Streptococcus sp. S5]|uniref:Phage protein n=1 Tax=Streptococcus lingualis TaxID=3098076 RepID=A0ABZ0SY94_9STRE|nr:hypothetical protein [Streptococcus sp. S5]WPS47573.1 hypothetical protein SM123_03580 [Streptococcus sp. S5]
MRFYVNSKYELVCAPDYHDKFGNSTADSLMINTGTFTNMLEEEIALAVNEVLKRYRHTIPKDLVDRLFEERKEQVRMMCDTSAILSEYMDGGKINEDHTGDENHE